MNGIRTCGLIHSSQSKERDAVLGDGVYLTHLGPEHGKEKILQNNYGKTAIPPTKADYYFKFVTNQLKGVEFKELGDGRTVWRFPRNIELSSLKYSVGHTEGANWTVAQAKSEKPNYHKPTAYVVPRQQQQQETEETGPGLGTSAYAMPRQQQQQETGPELGTALAVGATVAAIGVGLAALFGAFNRPNTRRQ